MFRKSILIVLMLLCNCGVAQRLYLETTIYPSKDSLQTAATTSKRFENYSLLNKHADSTFKTIQHKGYLNATYTLSQKNDSLFTQSIYKDRLQTYIKVYIPDADLLSTTRLGSSLSRKRNYLTTYSRQIDSLLQETHNELIANGNLFNRLELTDIIVKENDTVYATLKVTLEKQRKLERLVVVGYDLFPKNVLKHIKPQNAPLTKSTLSRLERNLNAIPFITKSKDPEFLFKKDSTLLYIYVQKNNGNNAEGFLGFNNTDGNATLTGNLDLRLLNNLNCGELLALKYRADDNEQRLLETTVELPYIFNTKIGVTGFINLLRRDTIYQNTSLKAGLFYKPQWNSTFHLNFVNRQSVSSGNIPPDEVQDLTSSGFEANYMYEQNRANRLKPIATRISLSGGYAQRSTRNLNNTNQYQLGLQLIKQWDILPKTSLYIHTNARALIGKNLFFNELYQLGGDLTIRGFRENSIDTSAYITLQTEVRYDLGSNFYTFSITDFGVFEDYTTAKPIDSYALGAGIGILTQGGILRISVANGSFNELNLDISSMIAQIKFTILF